MIGAFLKAGRTKILTITAALVAAIAFSDHAIGNRASLGVLYILPMMAGAIALSPWETAALAILCSLLRSWFDLPSPRLEVILRFVFALAAYTGAGLFVRAILRNNQLTAEHLEKIQREQAL